jgi:hypothetical protein
MWVPVGEDYGGSLVPIALRKAHLDLGGSIIEVERVWRPSPIFSWQVFRSCCSPLCPLLGLKQVLGDLVALRR